MLLKVSSILLAYMLIDGFFLKTYAANVSLSFEMPNHDGNICTVKQMTEKGELIVKNLTVYEGDRMNLTFTNNNFPNVIQCFVILKGQTEQNSTNLFTDEDVKKIHSEQNKPYVKSHLIDKVSVTNEGEWFCHTLTYWNNPFATFVYKDDKYLQHKCYVNVSVKPQKTDNINTPPIPSLWIYVGIAVGVLVLTIIIAQTAVILYLKYKAKKTARLDSLSLRAHDRDETDTKRYSKPPGVKMSRFSRMLRKSTTNDDETIYETLEELRNASLTEQTPPVPPIETIPTLKKKKSQSPEVTSKSLPRPKKARPTPPTPATLHHIPERQHSPELDISNRPPLPLPSEQPDERSFTPSRMQKTPFSPNEEAGHSTTNSLVRPRPGIGQSSVASELNKVLKMRKASMATASSPKFPPAPPKKHSFPSLRGKTNKVASDLDDSAEHGKFEPETPNPLPKGKSAILLGLAPGPLPKTKNTNAIKSPQKPFATSDTPPRPDPTSISPLKPFASKQTPVAIAPFAPKPSVKPGSLMLPRPSITSTKAPVAPSKLASVGKLPKPSMIAPNPQMSLKPVPQNLRPIKPMTTPNPHQPRFGKPAPQLPTPSIGKPPPPPPPKEPIEEAVYEDSEELFYNEEWTASKPHPPKFEKPAPPLPTASIGKPPPLPPSNRPTQEDVYEEFTEDVYNSDEEWVYEPLEKYNIYSN